VVRVRLTAARELLKDRRLSVSEIAERVGYSPKHFSEVYKETFGFPPRRPPK
jgi:transcriptional regulator GlxA family with amidase domain